MQSQTVSLEKLQRLAALPCPVVGLPIPGSRPFAFERRILGQLIEGLNGDTRAELLPPGCEFTPIVHTDYQRHEPEIARTPVLVISSPSDRREYKLVGRDVSFYRIGPGGPWDMQRHWGRHRRVINDKLHTGDYRQDRWGRTVQPAKPTPKPHKAVPAFLLRELKQAEKRLDRSGPPLSSRAQLFGWLHPKPPHVSDYGFVGDEHRKLTKPEREAQRLREIEERRQAVAEFYRTKPKRREVGRAVAGYFNIADFDFNDLRRGLRILGFTVKPWSQQPVAVRKIRNYDTGESDRPAYQTWYKPESEARYAFVKAIGRHLGLRKPDALDLWERGPGAISDVRQHNNAHREYREARERLEYLRAQIQAAERGEAVAFEDPAEEN